MQIKRNDPVIKLTRVTWGESSTEFNSRWCSAAGRAVCDWGDWGLCWCGGHPWRATLSCWYAERFSPPPIPSYSWRQCSCYGDAANTDTLNGIRIGCITIAQSILEAMLMSCFWWCHCGASRSGASFIRQTCDRRPLTFGLQIKFLWVGWMVESLKIIYQFPQDDKLPKTNTTRYFVCFFWSAFICMNTRGHLSCIGLRVSTKTPVLFLTTHWEFSPQLVYRWAIFMFQEGRATSKRNVLIFAVDSE